MRAFQRTWLIAGMVMVIILASLGPATTPVKPVAAATSCGGTTVGGIKVPSTRQSSTMAEVCKNHTLQAGVAVSFPWLMQDPKTSKYYGPTYFLAQKIVSLLHVKLQWVNADWSVVVAGLQADKYQVILSPLLDTPLRRKAISFANYSTDGNCYALLKSNTSVNKLGDLNDPKVRILTFTGTGNEQGVKAEFPKATDISIVQPPGGEIASLQQIMAGRADVAVIDSSTALVVVAKFPQFKIIPNSPKYCINHPDSPFAVGMGYRKGDSTFGAFLKAVVKKYKKTLDKLTVKYSNVKYWNG